MSIQKHTIRNNFSDCQTKKIFPVDTGLIDNSKPVPIYVTEAITTKV